MSVGAAMHSARPDPSASLRMTWVEHSAIREETLCGAQGDRGRAVCLPHVMPDLIRYPECLGCERRCSNAQCTPRSFGFAQDDMGRAQRHSGSDPSRAQGDRGRAVCLPQVMPDLIRYPECLGYERRCSNAQCTPRSFGFAQDDMGRAQRYSGSDPSRGSG